MCQHNAFLEEKKHEEQYLLLHNFEIILIILVQILLLQVTLHIHVLLYIMFVKGASLPINYLPRAKLCIDIPEDGISID